MFTTHVGLFNTEEYKILEGRNGSLYYGFVGWCPYTAYDSGRRLMV